MRLPRTWLVVVCAAAVGQAFQLARAGEEIAAKSAIVSAGLFKNGLSVIRRELKVPAPGTYLVEDAPEPVHGTWWVQSEVPIETRVTMREVSGTMRGTNLDLQRALVGKAVTIHFRDGQIPPATGKIEAIAPAKGDEAWNRTYQQPQYNSWGGYYQQPQGRFLVLQTENGRVFVEPTMIAYLKAEGKDEAVKQRAPVLLLTAGKAATVQITYLTRGLAWAPSYRVDIGDPKTLTIEQTAVIKNELDDIEGAEMQLISGFPSMQFAHVVSPLSLRTNWATFFQQLSQRFAPASASMANAFQQQARVLDNEPATIMAGDLAATPAGEGVDLHYQSIGPRTLKEGDALALSIAKESAPYERIVEWLVPDTRNEYGQFIQDYQRQQEPDKYRDSAWDAVRFKNPFKFAMTTGVAMVVSGARFNGQQMSYWVNAGEETSVKVTKSLSIRTRNVEQEEEGQREVIYIGGRQFRKPVVNGELSVNNHRKEEVKLVIRRHFSGELISADGEPKKSLREEGAYAVNPRYELTWSFSLKPGEGTTLKYKYSVLVSH